MKNKEIVNHIVDWLKNKLDISNTNGFVIGVSGGIDSALASTLASLTKKAVIVLNLPINQEEGQYSCSNEQIDWLKKRFNNVSSHIIDLTETFNSLKKSLPEKEVNGLALANTASRLRMTAIYSFANSNNYLVCGTGNKVEDYGIGFFTKYGDGGVDISPIADLLKSEIYELAKYLDVPQTIQDAVPTDGLWDDNRSDEEQIGASYEELEWALNYCDNLEKGIFIPTLEDRQIDVLNIYEKRHAANKHKLEAVPVCIIPELYK
jgi:NAD+ synthase